MKAVPNRNALAQAFDAWAADPTNQDKRRKLDVLMGPTTAGPDTEVYKKSDVILGPQGARGAVPQPAAKNTTPAPQPTEQPGMAPERGQQGATPQVKRPPTSSQVEIEKAAKAVDYLRQTVNDMRALPEMDFATLSVALQAVRRMAEG